MVEQTLSCCSFTGPGSLKSHQPRPPKHNTSSQHLQTFCTFCDRLSPFPLLPPTPSPRYIRSLGPFINIWNYDQGTYGLRRRVFRSYLRLRSLATRAKSSSSRGNWQQRLQLRPHALETVHPDTAASRHPINLSSPHTHAMAPKRKRDAKKGMSTSPKLFKHHRLIHNKAAQSPRHQLLLSSMLLTPTALSTISTTL